MQTWAQRKAQTLEQLLAVTATAAHAANISDMENLENRLQERGILLKKIQELDAEASLGDWLSAFPQLAEWNVSLERIRKFDQQLMHVLGRWQRSIHQEMSESRLQKTDLLLSKGLSEKGLQVEWRG